MSHILPISPSKESLVQNQARPRCPPGYWPGMSWDTARTLGGIAEPVTLSSYRLGPHLATQMPPSSQVQTAGCPENWRMKEETSGFPVSLMCSRQD